MNITRLHSGAQAVRRAFPGARPTYALILGSGWSGVSTAFTQTKSIQYKDIPCVGAPQAAGHPGRLILAQQGRQELLIFEGRHHWYEGQGWEPVAFPVYLAGALGVKILILTNAAGGLRRGLRAGRLMAINDHINAMGVNPLVGPTAAPWTDRFPDQQEVYDRALRKQWDLTARRIGEKLTHGVYMAVSGPTYETPAEIAAFRGLGADAVGMSTVPEAMLAHAAGIRVAAISCITNPAADPAASPLSHKMVLAETRKLQPRMKALLLAFLKDLIAHEVKLPALKGGASERNYAVAMRQPAYGPTLSGNSGVVASAIPPRVERGASWRRRAGHEA